MALKRKRESTPEILPGMSAEAADLMEKQEALTPDLLKTVHSFVERLQYLDDRITKGQEVMASLEKERREIIERYLVDLFDQAGLEEFKTADGWTLRLREDLYASIPKKNKEEAARWLIEHDHGALVNDSVLVSLPAGDHETFEKVVRALNRLKDVPVVTGRDMNTGRVKALIKELQEEGVDVPLDLFGAYQRRYVNVKKEK